MIEKDDLFEVDNKLYVVFDSLDFEGNNYCFCNEMLNDKTFGKNFVIFKNYPDGIELLEDAALVNRLLPIFSSTVSMQINEGYNTNMGEE